MRGTAVLARFAHVSSEAHILKSVLHRIPHGWCLVCFIPLSLFLRERLCGARLMFSASRCVSNSHSLSLSKRKHRCRAAHAHCAPFKYDTLLSEFSVTLQERGRDAAPGAAGMQNESASAHLNITSVLGDTATFAIDTKYLQGQYRQYQYF